MKKTNLILMSIMLFIMLGCINKNKEETHGLITIDVNAEYPKKELILQDFLDVEYIALETSDEFITQGIIKAIGKNILIITNRNLDGNIFIFDRKTGKGISKINRLGQGPEEYTQFTDIILDEINDEIFVVAYSSRNIQVYDLNGNFKRKLMFDDTIGYYNFIFNYDRESLICHKGYSPSIETESSSHILISKQDGHILKEISLPYSGTTKTPVIIKEEGSISPGFYLTTPNQKDWIIMRTSSDTIYNYSTDNNTLTPIILRTPTIQSMNPETFLFPTVNTGRYLFMRTMKKEFDFTTFKGFPKTDLVFDKQENSTFTYTVFNNDFLPKRKLSLGQKPSNSINQEIASSLTLNAFDLVEALEKDELTGRLKVIAQEINEESNPVIMLIKHRK